MQTNESHHTTEPIPLQRVASGAFNVPESRDQNCEAQQCFSSVELEELDKDRTLSDIHIPTTKRRKLKGEEADTAELDLATNMIHGCSVRSSMQTDITQPSDTSIYYVPGHLPNSEAPRPGELEYLLNPTAYYGRLDDLETRTAQTVGQANGVGPKTLILTETVPFPLAIGEGTQTMSEWPDLESTILRQDLMKGFLDSLFNTSQALCHLNSEGFCGKAFSLLVEDQARPGIANIVHVSLDDIHRPGTLPTEYASFLFERVIGLNYDGQAASWRATLLKYHLLGNLLPLALVSFTGSHVCRFGTNLWGQETDSIPVGLGYSFRPRELACLKDFIGGHAWILGKSQPDPIQPGLKLSLVVQDLQELWGPVWLVGGQPIKALLSELSEASSYLCHELNSLRSLKERVRLNATGQQRYPSTSIKRIDYC